MEISEAKGVSKAEEGGLRLLLPSPSSSTTAEALDEEKLEEKSDGGGISLEGTGWEESPSLEKHSTPSPSQLGKNERPCYPQRPGEPDCSFYLKAGSCRYGSNCKFNHPARRKRNKAKSTKQPESTEAAKEKEIGTSSEKVGKMEGKKVVNVKQNGALPKRLEHKNCKDVKEKQKQTPSEMVGKIGDKAVKEKQDKTLSKRMDQTDHQNYSMPGGSKFGKAWKYDQCKEKSVVGPVELNFLGLPMRPGERECYYYLRTGGCKFATNCRYHHPDPTAVGRQDTLSGYQNGGSPQQYASGASALPLTSWPLHVNSNESAPFFASGFLPLPPQGISKPEWNGYQAPAIPWLLPELNTGNSVASTVKDASEIAVAPTQPLLQVQVDEYPERPGQPECHHFMKNGDCKFKSACRFHHPRTRIQKDLSVSSPSREPASIT